MYAFSREAATRLWWRAIDGSGPATKLFVARRPHPGRGVHARWPRIGLPCGCGTTNRDIWMVPLVGDSTAVRCSTRHTTKRSRASHRTRSGWRTSPTSRPRRGVRPPARRDRRSASGVSRRRRRTVVGARRQTLVLPCRRQAEWRRRSPCLRRSPVAWAAASYFTARIRLTSTNPNYDVAPDGQSFVMVRPAAEGVGS
jgi:hypothetical protein